MRALDFSLRRCGGLSSAAATLMNAQSLPAGRALLVPFGAKPLVAPCLQEPQGADGSSHCTPLCAQEDLPKHIRAV